MSALQKKRSGGRGRASRTVGPRAATVAAARPVRQWVPRRGGRPRIKGVFEGSVCVCVCVCVGGGGGVERRGWYMIHAPEQ